MSGQWTNKFAIMRDLSLAQGCVPAEVDRPVGAEDKPPVQLIVEETEEEFFKNCSVGEGDFAAPDLGLIKQMLDMVRESDVSSDLEDGDVEGAVEIYKLNPFSPEFVPSTQPRLGLGDLRLTDNVTAEEVEQSYSISIKNQNGENGTFETIPLKNDTIALKNATSRNKRNVAITSLLAIASKKQESEIIADKENKESNCLKLLKPTDFVVTNNLSKSSGTVDSSLEIEKTNNVSNKAKAVLMLNPSSMFKKKTNDMKNTVPVPLAKAVTSIPQSTNYVPSSRAKEYLKKYELQSKMKQMMQEDIWARAEREMKELDEKRKLNALMSSQQSLSSETTSSSETAEQSN